MTQLSGYNIMSAVYIVLEMRQPKTKEERIEFVTRKVCKYLQVEYEMLFIRCRYPDIVEARQVAWYICRLDFGIKDVELGRAFKLDRTTVFSGVNKMVSRVNYEPDMRETVRAIQELIKNEFL